MSFFISTNQRFGSRRDSCKGRGHRRVSREEYEGGVRRDHDLLGERDVPLSAYYGIQTLRGMENFPISGMPLKNFAHFVDPLAMVKKGAAQANGELGVLAKEKMEAICAACDEILAGKLHDQFVVDMIQGGPAPPPT